MLKLLHVPKLSNSLFYTPKRDKHLFLNTDLPNWLVLNQNAAYIVNLIDGQKTIADIFNILVSLNAKMSESELLELFISLKKHGIIDDDDLIEQKILASKKISSHPKLHIVHIKLTDECNLSCKYCYAESGAVAYKSFLSLDELKKIADDVKKITTHASYTLSGGEPLLYPQIFEYMEYLKNLGNTIYLLTNGMYINEENVSTIAKFCSVIKISLDGSSEEINSITRGKNSFDSAFRGYKLLVDEGANVQISMTVTKANISDISNMVKLFGSRLTLQPFFKTGRGAINDDLQITGLEYYQAMANVDGFKPMARIGELLEGIKNRGGLQSALWRMERSAYLKMVMYFLVKC
ncbi:MAG: radical SAM protein [Sulfurimonas sp.]|uniref:radical SAM protein n=1 Tax=Sulfurimonas sp. TaxID=2022749 RepID=UPI002629AF23|nr:radical SAM protein [Sulfurimonas sp.]MDD5371872.1 radical SAM protein [Sulfurimonas sp.]